MIRSLLHRFMPRPAETAPPVLFRPEQPICIIGDLHGRLDLLEAMFALIGNQPGAETVRLIFVGDMIDRGAESAGVLRRLHRLSLQRPDRVICLAGNHEQMFLNFLSDPAGQGRRWISAGGGETLASLGVTARAEGTTPAERFTALAKAACAALPPGMVEWLSGLPHFWQEGNLAVVHAAADPSRRMEDQSEKALLWGHPTFRTIGRPDGLWIAHGHVVVAKAQADAGRIAVDTGAWRTGRLSAAWLDSEGLRFLEATV